MSLAYPDPASAARWCQPVRRKSARRGPAPMGLPGRWQHRAPLGPAPRRPVAGWSLVEARGPRPSTRRRTGGRAPAMVADPPVLIAGRYRLHEPDRLRRHGPRVAGVGRAAEPRRGRQAAALPRRPAPRPTLASPTSARCARPATPRACTIPNAVPVFDVVDHDGQPCLVMQYLPSRSLHAVLAERGPLPVARGRPARQRARVGARRRAPGRHRAPRRQARQRPRRRGRHGAHHRLRHLARPRRRVAHLDRHGDRHARPTWPRRSRVGRRRARPRTSSRSVRRCMPPSRAVRRSAPATTRWPCCTGSRPARSPRPARAHSRPSCSRCSPRPRRPSLDAGGLGGPRHARRGTRDPRPQRRRRSRRPRPDAGDAHRRTRRTRRTRRPAHRPAPGPRNAARRALVVVLHLARHAARGAPRRGGRAGRSVTRPGGISQHGGGGIRQHGGGGTRQHGAGGGPGAASGTTR